ncbi:MAG: hypothetical protein J6S58_09070 [Lentisphaeria bacterium]|nr:hypothetical protein [Lentisphaeria bacterium]
MNTPDLPVLENEFLRVTVDPSCGGRVISLLDLEHGFEHVAYDASYVPADPEKDYDSNFAGGMDELLPCDLPEHSFPDHGELWNLKLEYEFSSGNVLHLRGKLPISSLYYERTMKLSGKKLCCTYSITNQGQEDLHFLWKLHGAMKICKGDRLSVPAECIQAADPGDWSKASDGMPRKFVSPYIVGEMDKSSDFFFLTDLQSGEATLCHENGRALRCTFDLKIFPTCWIFCSFGRLNDSRCMILEPCTNYPLSLDDAVKNRCCAFLPAGESLHTAVFWECL